METMMSWGAEEMLGAGLARCSGGRRLGFAETAQEALWFSPLRLKTSLRTHEAAGLALKKWPVIDGKCCVEV